MPNTTRKSHIVMHANDSVFNAVDGTSTSPYADLRNQKGEHIMTTRRTE